MASETGDDAPANRSRKKRLSFGAKADSGNDASAAAAGGASRGDDVPVEWGRAEAMPVEDCVCTGGGGGGAAGESEGPVPSCAGGARGGETAGGAGRVQWGVLPCSRAV